MYEKFVVCTDAIHTTLTWKIQGETLLKYITDWTALLQGLLLLMKLQR